MSVTLAQFKQAFAASSSATSAAPSPLAAAPPPLETSAPTAVPSKPVGWTPPSPGASKKSDKDLLDQAIDDALGKAEKRAKALLTWKVHKFSEDNKKAPELDKYFSDLESGIAKVQEHVKYVTDVLGYVEKYGKPELLEGIRGSVTRVKSIADRLGKGVGKIQTSIDAVRNIREFAKTAGTFVGLTAAMDPKNPDSVQKWAESMRGLWDASAPYMEWLQNKQLVEQAMQGSKLAGSMAATLPIVAAQFAVGIEALNAGVKNVNAYLNRLKKWERIIDEQTGARRPAAQPPAPPTPPLEWVSTEDREVAAVAMEDSRLRSVIQAEGAQRAEAAAQQFEKTVFPKLYQSTLRPQIVDTISKSKRAFIERRRAAEKKQATFDPRWERTSNRLAMARASIQKLRDANPNDPNIAKLEKLEKAYDDELRVIDGEMREFDRTERPFLVNLDVVHRQYDEWNDLLKQDIPTQIARFLALEKAGRGFPTFHQFHDDELEKHLQAAAAEYRKEVAKKLG